MKKILILLTLLFFAGTAFALDSTESVSSRFIKKGSSLWSKPDKLSKDLNTKITKQQKKYEEQKAARDAKILEKQKQNT